MYLVGIEPRPHRREELFLTVRPHNTYSLEKIIIIELHISGLKGTKKQTETVLIKDFLFFDFTNSFTGEICAISRKKGTGRTGLDQPGAALFKLLLTF